MTLQSQRYLLDLPTSIKVEDYTLSTHPDLGDAGYEIAFSSAEALTCSLPPATEAGNGFTAVIRNIGGGTLSISPDSPEKLDGQTSVDLSQDEWRWIRCDGTGWASVSQGALGGASTGSGAGGGLTVIDSFEITASTNSIEAGPGLDLDVTFDTTYDVYMFMVVNLDTDAACELHARTSSTLSPVSYDAGAGAYGAYNGGADDTYMRLTNTNVISSGKGFCSRIWLYGPADTYGYSHFCTELTMCNDNGGRPGAQSNASYRKDASAVQAVKFYLSASANMTKGRFYVYGLEKPAV